MQNQTVIEKQFPEIHRRLLESKHLDAIADVRQAESRELLRGAMLDLRSKIGLTAKAFGSAMGVSKGYVYLLEKGDRPWNDDLIKKLQDGLQSL